MFLVLKSMVIKSIAVRIHVEHTRLNARQKNSVAKYTYGYSSKYTYTTNTSIDMGINVRGISRSVSCLYVRLTLYAPPIQLGFYLLTSSKIHWFSSLRLMWRMCVLVQMMMPVLCCAVSVASYLVYYNAEHFIPFGFNSSTRFICTILSMYLYML